DRLFHRVEDGHAMDGLAAPARHHAADDLGAVIQHLLRVELGDAARDALHDDAGVAIYEDGHWTALTLVFCAVSFCQAMTARWAASISVVARMIGRPDLARIFSPSSTLVPARRTITGTSTASAFSACTTPSATQSQRLMPAKMLTSTACTFLSDVTRRNALATRSGVAPPP